MTVSAPPRPPQTPPPPRRRDPVEQVDPEALIEEARQRTRRRRRIYAAAAAALALLGASLFVVFSRPEPSQSAASEQPPLPVPADLDDSATLVAHFRKFQVGWVAVYSDGRVIRSSDSGSSNDAIERRLTADGLDQVRSGGIKPRALFMDFYRSNGLAPSYTAARNARPAGTWADANFKPYVPSGYAIFYHGNEESDATEVLGRLPASVQALLRGNERTYHRIVFTGVPSGAQYLEVSATEAPVVRENLRGPFELHPLLPHGEPIYFPG